MKMHKQLIVLALLSLVFAPPLAFAEPAPPKASTTDPAVGDEAAVQTAEEGDASKGAPQAQAMKPSSSAELKSTGGAWPLTAPLDFLVVLQFAELSNATNCHEIQCSCDLDCVDLCGRHAMCWNGACLTDF